MKIRPYLITRSLVPENQETPIHFLRHVLFEDRYFFRRNHFPYPSSVHQSVMISGLVQSSFFLSLDQLKRMPSTTLIVPLECAGNQRAKFTPTTFGEQWESGAISQGKWTGIPLKDILTLAKIHRKAKEVIFIGADFGTRNDMDGLFHYARSLPLDKAMHPDTIIAYEYNDSPLSLKRGFPFRLIVPQWYAMASVKWLKYIIVTDQTFTGPFQSIDYVYYPHPNDDEGKMSVTTMNVNSLIQFPLPYSLHRVGTILVTGIAWTGEGIIQKVEVSVDNGQTWNRATLKRLKERYAWVQWEWRWEVHKKGEYTILAKATDSSGRTQPFTSMWNRKGYGYNAIQKVHIKIE
ncbi:sulfite oxidase [Parageobacillus sp. G301]|uniref:sulfite oxidase n=1 Tax=Parageobacillus sp. G301 TaxID=2998290 RepID=UPI0024971B02|nr:sulfite oxidase [Parageobacillus sp. G301]GLH62678.1 oxidoreductase [Parageobacillus sp. G301]